MIEYTLKSTKERQLKGKKLFQRLTNNFDIKLYRKKYLELIRNSPDNH